MREVTLYDSESCLKPRVVKLKKQGNLEAGTSQNPRISERMDERPYFTQGVFRVILSQFPHKFVNLSFIITNVMNRLTNLRRI